jgi:co-chaperonin GroES (HSP10)
MVPKTERPLSPDAPVAGLKLRPLADRIIVRRDSSETKSPGGIVIPDRAQEKSQKGTVLAVGPGRLAPVQLTTADLMPFRAIGPAPSTPEAQLRDMQEALRQYREGSPPIHPVNPSLETTPPEWPRIPPTVQVGDHILFQPYAGAEIEVDGQKLILMREEDVLAIEVRTEAVPPEPPRIEGGNKGDQAGPEVESCGDLRVDSDLLGDFPEPDPNQGLA